jgi:endoglucanase
VPTQTRPVPQALRSLRLVLVLAVLVTALLTVLTAPTLGTTGASAPAVRVTGNQLVDVDGRPVRLLGVNKAGTEYACAQGWGIFDGPVDEAAVTAMVSWRVSAVRVPLNEHCWLGRNGVAAAFSGEVYRSAVQAYVDRLHAAGLVAVLDLHWSAPGSALARGQAMMADADHSVDFWTSVATRFRDDPSVVFELFNEPHDISWDCWQLGCLTVDGWRAAGMQQLLDAVRATGARQPVVATGTNGAATSRSGSSTRRPTRWDSWWPGCTSTRSASAGTPPAGTRPSDGWPGPCRS